MCVYLYINLSKDSAFIFVDHFLLLLLLMFSILFIYAFDFFFKFPSFYFCLLCFYEDQSVKKQTCAGFYQGWIHSSLGSSPRGLVGKIREKVIGERRWKAEGLPDES